MSATNNKMWMPSGFKQKIVELVLEIAHAKRKRCLVMAELCQWKTGVFIYKEEKSEFYHRWYKRWLKLAEYYTED